MAKLLLGIEENAANSNAIVLRSELPVNPICRPPDYLPKPEPRPPAVKPGTYRVSGLVQERKKQLRQRHNLATGRNRLPEPAVEDLS